MLVWVPAASIVGVVPECSSRMVVWNIVFVSGIRQRRDMAENVVVISQGRHMKSMNMEVRVVGVCVHILVMQPVARLIFGHRVGVVLSYRRFRLVAELIFQDNDNLVATLDTKSGAHGQTIIGTTLKGERTGIDSRRHYVKCSVEDAINTGNIRWLRQRRATEAHRIRCQEKADHFY